ncbi:MAG: glycoside hydrolase family 3 protein [Chlorobiaceae bacterium]|nr:glycoside hydrolase family 3 protein [Chlorobiaceae bacterium]
MPFRSPSKIFFLLLLLVFRSPSVKAEVATSSPSRASANTLVKELFSRKVPWVEEKLKSMSIPEKVGQMIVAKVDAKYDSCLDPQYILISRLASEGRIGGIMFLKGDLLSAGMLANHFQAVSDVPLLVSADMERGLAMRLEGATKFSPAMAVSATGDAELARSMATIVATEARAVGIQQNYAPTVDLNINPANPVINTRSFGDSIPLTITMSAAVIDGLQSNGIIATAKHFPGHGDVTVDSHLALPVLEGDRTRLDNYELKPFRAAIAQGVLCVMVGHLAVPKLTGSLEPASLSEKIVTGLLRLELGFNGLIVTDALNMKALQNGQPTETIYLQAVQAGNDILLYPDDPEIAHNAVTAAVEKGDIPVKRIDASVRRILLLKQWLGLDRQKLVDLSRLNERVGTNQSALVAARIAENSLTLIRDQKGLLPLHLPVDGRIVNIILNDRPGETIGTSFADKLGMNYPVTSFRITPGSSPDEYRKASKSIEQASAVIITTGMQAWSNTIPSRLSELQRNFVRKLSALAPAGTPVIFISFGTPYILEAFPEIGTALCSYSENPYAETAIIKALKGELIPQGKLPVSLNGMKP